MDTDKVLEGEVITDTLPVQDPPETKSLVLDLAPLQALKDGQRLTVPRNPHFSRKDVVNAFQSAFDLVGGVPRLAIWADGNYAEFIKLYGKLIPGGASQALGESNVLRLEMAIPKSPLDYVDPEAEYALKPPQAETENK